MYHLQVLPSSVYLLQHVWRPEVQHQRTTAQYSHQSNAHKRPSTGNCPCDLVRSKKHHSVASAPKEIPGLTGRSLNAKPLATAVVFAGLVSTSTRKFSSSIFFKLWMFCGHSHESSGLLFFQQMKVRAR